MDQEVLDRLASEAGDGSPDFSIDDLSDFEDYLSKDKNHRIRAVILGLAVHFTPSQALASKFGNDPTTGPYDSDLEPYMMIYEYLLSEFNADEKTARRVAEKLGKLWDDWIEDGRYVSYEDAIKKKLRDEQGNQCKNCNVKLDDEEASIAYQQEDHFKPIHEFSYQQTAIELDHIEPLSQFGNSDITNLQLLCRFCNQGKGNRIHVPISNQIEYAHAEISEIPESHRREMFYAVSGNTEACQMCGTISKELTLQLKNPEGCYVVSNLETVCVDCRFGE
jgi:hypothetical protein